MFLGLGGTYVLIATLLVAFVLRAKNLAVSDGLRFHEDLEQMRAIRTKKSLGSAPTRLHARPAPPRRTSTVDQPIQSDAVRPPA